MKKINNCSFKICASNMKIECSRSAAHTISATSGDFVTVMRFNLFNWNWLCIIIEKCNSVNCSSLVTITIGNWNIDTAVLGMSEIMHEITFYKFSKKKSKNFEKFFFCSKKFDPYQSIFWDRHRAQFLGKKSKNKACDVTVGTKKIKYAKITAYAKMTGDMPLRKKYMPLFGTVTGRAFRKKIQSTNHILINAMLRSGYFSENHARCRSCVLDFFQDSPMTVKYRSKLAYAS